MNDLYEKSITVNGVVYHYDPDRDVYYRRYGDLTTWDRWGWIGVIIVMALLAWLLTLVN